MALRRPRVSLLMTMLLVALAGVLCTWVAAERRKRVAFLRAELNRKADRVRWAERMTRLGYLSKGQLAIERTNLERVESELGGWAGVDLWSIIEGPEMRFRLGTLMLVVTILGLVAALVTQGWRARHREADLQSELQAARRQSEVAMIAFEELEKVMDEREDAHRREISELRDFICRLPETK